MQNSCIELFPRIVRLCQISRSFLWLHFIEQVLAPVLCSIWLSSSHLVIQSAASSYTHWESRFNHHQCVKPDRVVLAWARFRWPTICPICTILYFKLFSWLYLQVIKASCTTSLIMFLMELMCVLKTHKYFF